MSSFRSLAMAVFWCTAGSASAALAATTIYECSDEHGRRTFSDRGCPDQQIYQPSTAPPVRFEPIAPADLQRLQRAAQELDKSKRAQAEARRLRQEAHRDAALERKESCQQATEALAAMAIRRRKGYSLAAQPDLDDAQALWKRRKRDNC